MIKTSRLRHLQPFLSAFIVLLLASCMDRELVRVDPVTETYILDQITTSGSSGVDILVLVDNSYSMADEQAHLVQNFPELIRSLLQPEDAVSNVTREPPPDGLADHVPIKDMHIGVVSSDMGTGGKIVDTCADSINGDDGVLQNVPNPMIVGCDAIYPMYLSYASETPPPVRAPRDPAIPDIEKLAKDFGCIATLGNRGCGFEQQMEAVLKALTAHASPPVGDGVNAGFLREGTILAVLFVTDEEDCSVDITNPANLRIFDTALDAELGSMNLRCMLHPEMVYAGERYVDEFSELRTPVEDFVVGMIVGVPTAADAPECNGFIEALGGCLDNPLMQALEDPARPGLMRQSCVNEDSTKGAYPPRRFIRFGQLFMATSPETLGQNVYVHSICSDDYTPAITAITNKIHEIADRRGTGRELELVKDPLDPRGCTCMAECSIIETMPGLEDCVAPKTTYDGDGDTAPDVSIDETGQRHTLCEIPNSEMTITAEECACCGSTSPENPGDCACTLNCNAAAADLVQRMCGADPCTGWWYSPYYDPDGPGPLVPSPTIMLTGVLPAEGSTTNIACRSIVCPSLRQCGPGKCCDINEFCYYPGDDTTQPGLCLVRPDVCAEYGSDLWCPYELLGLPGSYQGVCCLDFNMDGTLDMADSDGDTLLDETMYRCDGTQCVRR